MKIPSNKSVAILFGAGAVKNGWLPIIRAIQPSYFKKQISIDAANSYLARLIYLLRWSYAPKDDTGDYGLEDYQKILKNTKEQICTEIAMSSKQGEIKVQDEFYSIINEIILSNFRHIMMVSTNWDTVFEDAVNSMPIIQSAFDEKLIAAHIHGIYLDPTTLYLPTEVCEEPFRSKGEEHILGSLHLKIMEQITRAEIIIFYGLSLSPLDAELTQILSVGLDNPNLKLIIIIDPNHAVVADKINILLKYPSNVTVTGYSPYDLKNGVLHSLVY